MTAGHRDLDERGGKTLLETSRTHIHTQKRKKKHKKKNKKQKKIDGKKPFFRIQLRDFQYIEFPA